MTQLAGVSHVETYRGTVYPWEIDHMGHMNVQFYAAKFDSATWQLFGAIGMTPKWLRENSRGMAAIEQTIKYRAELIAGDLVVVRSTITEISTSSIRFQHVMMNCETGEESASADLIGVHIDLYQRKSCALPQSVRRRAEQMAR